MLKKRRDPNKSSQPRTIDELRYAAYHIRYEREMLRFTGARLTRSPLPTGLDFAVLMESFLIHVRNLNEFFYGLEMAQEGKKAIFQDDVVVEDFFDSQKPLTKPQTNRLPDDLRQRINDQLAHVTYARQVGHYGDWDFSDLQLRMDSLTDLFFNSVFQRK